MSVTRRSKSYFWSSLLPRGTAYDRFMRQNKPTESIFKKLFDSIPFINDAADTASLTSAGHVKAATDQEVIDRKTPVQYGDGHVRAVQPHQIPNLGGGSEFEYVIFVDSERGEDTYDERRGQTDKPYKTLTAARDRAGGYYVKGTPTYGYNVITAIDPLEIVNARIGDILTFNGGAHSRTLAFTSVITEVGADSLTLESDWDISDLADNYSFRVIPVDGLKRLIIVMPGDYEFGENEKYMQYGNYDIGACGLSRAGLDWYFHPGANITILDTNAVPLFSNEYTYSYFTQPRVDATKVTVTGGSNVYGRVSIINDSDIPVYKGLRNQGSKKDGANHENFQFNTEGNVFEFHKIVSSCNTADILIDLIPGNIYPIELVSGAPTCVDEFGDPITFWGQSELMDNTPTRNLNEFTIKGNYMYNSTGVCIEVYEATVKVEIDHIVSTTTLGCIFDGTVGSVTISRLRGAYNIIEDLQPSDNTGTFHISGKFYGLDLVLNINHGNLNYAFNFISVRGIRENVHTDEHSQGKVTVYGNSQYILATGGIVNIIGSVRQLTVVHGQFFNDLPVGWGYDAPDVKCDWVTHHLYVDCVRATVNIGQYGFKSEEGLDTNLSALSPWGAIRNSKGTDDGPLVIIQHANIQDYMTSLRAYDNSVLYIDNLLIMGGTLSAIPGLLVEDSAEVHLNNVSVNGTKLFRYALPNPQVYPITCQNLADTASLGAAMNKNYLVPNHSAISVMGSDAKLFVKDLVSNDKAYSPIMLYAGATLVLNGSYLYTDPIYHPTLVPVDGTPGSFIYIMQGGVSMNYVDSGPDVWGNLATIQGQTALVHQDLSFTRKMKTI